MVYANPVTLKFCLSSSWSCNTAQQGGTKQIMYKLKVEQKYLEDTKKCYMINDDKYLSENYRVEYKI